MERGEQSAGRAEGDVPTTGAPGSSQGSQVPQQQEQERSQEGQNQPFTTSPTQERGTTPPGPPAPPKTGRESVALGVRRLSMNPERYPPDEAGAPSASGHITPSRDYARGGVPPPQRARSRDDGAAYRSGEGVVPPTRRRGSGLDWIIPGAEQKQAYTPRVRTAGERLQPTLDHAIKEKAKYERKAMFNGYLLNAAIGLQVLLGALVTGLSAAVSPARVGLVTSILGGLSTLVASYLARMRGSNEPELSITRTKDLDQFIRECDSFQMDRGHVAGGEEDHALEEFRRRFEELLGNANGERKLSPA